MSTHALAHEHHHEERDHHHQEIDGMQRLLLLTMMMIVMMRFGVCLYVCVSVSVRSCLRTSSPRVQGITRVMASMIVVAVDHDHVGDDDEE